MVAGSILIPLGVVLILIAWYGRRTPGWCSSRSPTWSAGPSSGWAAWWSGGFLFFGHWLYRMYDQADLHHEEQLRALQAIAAVC